MPPVDDKAAAKAAADKTESEKKAANEGAASVAEAVKRVADAAVAAVQKADPVAPQPFSFTAKGVGGRFTIDGAGFGTGGAVTVGGKAASMTGWGSTHIEGQMPAGVKSGQNVVEVIIDNETKQTGTFTLA